LKLQTHIQLTPEKNQIDYESKVLLLGSCFTENIGGKLEYFKFQNLQNPFGIIFNPVSILGLVERAIRNEYFTEADIFQKEENWYCFEVHSSISSESEATFLTKLNNTLQQFKEYFLLKVVQKFLMRSTFRIKWSVLQTLLYSVYFLLNCFSF